MSDFFDKVRNDTPHILKHIISGDFYEFKYFLINRAFMLPAYDLEKIKYATDASTFEKAVELYEKGKITQFEEGIGAYFAVVLGTKPYRVSVEARRYDYGHCECYLGQNDTLCKHMVAVAIQAVTGGRPLTEEEKRLVSQPTCSGRLGELSKEELAVVKREISGAIRYIKSYEGPSRTWFAYQNSLSEGCNRLSKIVSELPVSEQTAKLLVDTLFRLDKKLSYGGIDDSDGTVGGFMEETVQVLKGYAKLDSACVKAFSQLEGKETCFGWEEPLLEPTGHNKNPGSLLQDRKIQIIPDSEENRYMWDDKHGIVDAPEREIFEPHTRISTGAGGEGSRLRYYIVFHQREKRIIGEKEKRTISKIFTDVARDTNAVIENARFKKTHVLFQVLVPFNVAVGSFIEKGIASSLKELPFLCESYFVTNVKKPTTKDLKKFLAED